VTRPPPRPRAALAAALLGLALGAAPRLPRAADAAPRPLPCALEARGGRLLATLDLAPAFPAGLEKQLSNGLTNVVALHVALLPERGRDPAALFGREIDVLYDVWEETWGVTVRDAASPAGRQRTFASFAGLRTFLTEARAVDLGAVDDLGERRWVVQTRVELNPVSEELLRRTREFIANPAAGGRGGTPSRSVLGAFASYLLRGADPGADVHLFRSPAFSAGEVPRR
jgi:hypothetical protein